VPTTIAELKQRQDEKDAAGAKLGEQHEVTGNTWEVSIPRTRICTLEQLVEHCKIDLNTWTVKRFVANKWEVGAKNPDSGKIEVEPLFQIKAFLERRVEVADAVQELDELKRKAKLSAKPWVSIDRKISLPSGNMLEVNLPDLHAGKLAWQQETGGPNYDTKIAIKGYWDAFNTLLSRVKHFEFEQVLFVVGNDLLNSDDTEGRTNAGTQVSTDVRYQKTFGTVRDTMIESIERLRRIAPVKVVMVPGNHDKLSVWHLGDSLECYFHKYEDVEIDNRPRQRKYHQFGLVGLMFYHGNKGKKADYPLTMATEMRKMFGATKFNECHTGHLHKSWADEFHGVIVRILSALCPADAWHSENNFIGNQRTAEAFVWNKDEGLITIARYTATEEDEEVA
jgi:hypothetical protein